MYKNRLAKRANVVPKQIGTILITVLFLLSLSLKAQYLDSKGNDFWFTFLPNFHGSKTIASDTLNIFITSEVPTSGTIKYTDIYNRLYTQNFQIPDPSQIYTFKLNSGNFELFGFNTGGINLYNRNFSEVIANVSFHIVSDNEVTVYALSQAINTSDAFLVLPTDALNNEYFIMAYNSDGYIYAGAVSTNSTPSQFAVVATEDNTKVTIVPSSPTRYNFNLTQQITLNQGQCYLVQSDIQPNMLINDLTGSEIISDKPVAVFAGHQRATIPYKISLNPSRDFIVEQLPPVSTWGENAYVIPYIQPKNVMALGTDLFRILAAFDNTEIFENDIYKDIINKGEFREYPLTKPLKITASKPILVTQYKKTCGTNPTSNISDPFMMVIPPVEQFMNKYRVINAQGYENRIKVYTEQYIAIVAPNNILNSITLDGAAVPIASFIPIPTSNYSYANVQVNDNVHSIEADEGIGIYVYGYGEVNSYGYVGGMNFRPLDLMPPEIASESDCFKIKGIVYDSTAGDSHLKEVTSPDSVKENVTVNIEKFTPYKDSVTFSATLKNIYLDGKFSISAEDSIGFKTNVDFEIPGFTVSSMLALVQVPIPYIRDSARTNSTFRLPFVITNYGKFPQTIDNVILNNSNFKIFHTLPKTLQPGDIDTIWVEFSSSTDSTYIDTLLIGNPCTKRAIYALNIKFEYDRKNPKILKNADSCNTSIRLIITDSTSTDLGLEKVTIVDSTNCEIKQLKYSNKICEFEISVINPKKIAYYRIIATDSVGHQTEITDTIKGFTLSFPDFVGINPYIDFGTKKIGSLTCLPIKIYNYGEFSITLNDVYMAGNIVFSIPQSQFPLTLEQGETRELNICFRPISALEEQLKDSLNLFFNCLKSFIELKGSGEPIVRNINSQCDVQLKFTTYEISGEFSLGQNYPNPCSITTLIPFTIGKEENVNIVLYNIWGNRTKTIVSSLLKAGFYEVELNTGTLSNGIYFYEMRANGVKFTRTMLIGY